MFVISGKQPSFFLKLENLPFVSEYELYLPASVSSKRRDKNTERNKGTCLAFPQILKCKQRGRLLIAVSKFMFPAGSVLLS